MPKAAGSGLLAAPDRFWFRRRQFGRAQLPLVLQPGKPAAEADELPYFRASSVSKLMTDQGGLETWKINGHMWAVAHDESLLLAVQAVEDFESDEGKQQMRFPRDRAERIAGMIEKRENGTALHSLFMSAALGKPLPRTMSDLYAGVIRKHLRMLSLFAVTAFELTVVCDELGIGGSLDMGVSPLVAMTPTDRKGRRIAPDVQPTDVVVGDVKTSAGKCEYMGEHALQLAPYARSFGYREVEDPAILAAQRETGQDLWTPQAKRARVGEFHRTEHGARGDVALIFHTPSDGSSDPHLHWLDLDEGFEAARHAMGTRAWRNKLPGLCSPAEPPDLMKILESPTTTREQALELYRRHRDGAWTDEHMTVCLQRWPREGAA